MAVNHLWFMVCPVVVISKGEVTENVNGSCEGIFLFPIHTIQGRRRGRAGVVPKVSQVQVVPKVGVLRDGVPLLAYMAAGYHIDCGEVL